MLASFKNYSYTKKGLIIGLVAGIIIIISTILFLAYCIKIPFHVFDLFKAGCNPYENYFEPIFILVFGLAGLISRFTGLGMNGSSIIAVIVSILIFPITGFFIGKIVDKIKSKNQNINN
ncbi:MAG: hypothetical protein Q8L47_01790 [bacterium]|nr:hypothetical protein [bacterium]